MTVSITISESIDGAQVSDSLEGGDTGVDLGSVSNGLWAPFTAPQSSNLGAQVLYIHHDATIDPITGLKVHIEEFSGTYGGARTAADDYTAIKALGNASGSSKNNIDGNSGGLWLDMDSDVSAINQFDWATNGIGQGGNDTVAIFGDSGTDGIDEASAFQIAAAAMVYDDAGEQQPSAAEAGKVGKSGDTVLGDNAKLKFRIYLPSSHAEGGIYQHDYVYTYSFTA
jgi:hypothetical protein